MNLMFKAICTYLFVIHFVVSEDIVNDCSADGICTVKNESTHSSLNLYSKGESTGKESHPKFSVY